MYKYLCKDCGGMTKIFHRMTEDKAPDKCIQCGSAKLRGVYSPLGISVKGASLLEAYPCCGRETPCNTSPCSDSGVCQRY